MSRNKASREHTFDLPSPTGPARFPALLRSRWRAVRAPVRMAFSLVIGRCHWKGDFVRRRGGPAVRSDVEFKGHLPADIQPGEVVPAVDTGAPFEVFQPGNRAVWLGALGLTILGGIWVLATAGVIAMRFRPGGWLFRFSR